jgi:uncharacterized membrane protein
MRQMVLQYIVVLVVFLAIDAVWLSTAARLVYRPEIGQLLKDQPDFLVAFAFYAIYALGLLVFIIVPNLAAADYGKALLYGAFFGLVAYATYDMTNLSTMKGFTTKIAVIDMVWGSFLSASVSVLAIWLIRLLKI